MNTVMVRTKPPEIVLFSHVPAVGKNRFCLFPQHKDLHLVLLVFSIMPTIPSLRHQQCDNVTLSKAEQCAVVTSSMRENGLHT